MSKQNLGMLAACLSNIIFGFSFIFSKKALAVSNPLVILAVRFTVSFLFMLLLILFKAVKVSFKGKNIRGLIMMSAAQPLLYFILELYGIKYTSSALSGIIISLVPVGVVILSLLFLKEKPDLIQILCTVLSVSCVAAVSAMSKGGGKNTAFGAGLLFLAVMSAAAFNILSRKESQSFSPFERTVFMFGTGSIGYNFIAVINLRGEFLSQVAKSFSSSDFIISIVYLSLVSSVGAFMLFNFATSNISAVRSASFSNIITVVSILAGIFIMHERLNAVQLLLCIPIILGVWGVNSGLKIKKRY